MSRLRRFGFIRNLPTNFNCRHLSYVRRTVHARFNYFLVVYDLPQMPRQRDEQILVKVNKVKEINAEDISLKLKNTWCVILKY